jgi:hypothetical protein
MLHASPELLDEDVVKPAAAASRAHPNAMLGQHTHEALARELQVLVGVEERRRIVTRYDRVDPTG